MGSHAARDDMPFKSIFIAFFIGSCLIVAAMLVNRGRR